MLAMVYHGQQKWALADSVYREAMPYFEVIPALATGYLSDYATMKVLQPKTDPEGAVALLNRYLELKGSFGINEAGVYAYAQELLGNKEIADAIIPELRSAEGTDAYTARIWLARIDVHRGDYKSAFWEQAETYREESEYVQKTLEDSVTQALRDDAARQAEKARANLRYTLILFGGVFFAFFVSGPSSHSS